MNGFYPLIAGSVKINGSEGELGRLDIRAHVYFRIAACVICHDTGCIHSKEFILIPLLLDIDSIAPGFSFQKHLSHAPE